MSVGIEVQPQILGYNHGTKPDDLRHISLGHPREGCGWVCWITASPEARALRQYCQAQTRFNLATNVNMDRYYIDTDGFGGFLVKFLRPDGEVT
jgi:hypothetical protein